MREQARPAPGSGSVSGCGASGGRKVGINAENAELAVRPVTLIDANPSTRTKVLSRFRAVSVVGRADVAAWLLRAVADLAPIVDRTPMIGWC